MGYPVFTEFGADLDQVFERAGFELEVFFGPNRVDDLGRFMSSAKARDWLKGGSGGSFSGLLQQPPRGRVDNCVTSLRQIAGSASNLDIRLDTTPLDRPVEESGIGLHRNDNLVQAVR